MGVFSTTFAVGIGQTVVGDPFFGAILYFNLTTCPAGWTEVLAGRGRYIVGHQPGAIVGNSIGAALGVDENRPVGQHSHGINDPGHSHTYSAAVATSTGSGNSKAGYATQQTSRDTTGITIKDAGTVPGTNAPYVVLLMCQKN